MIRKTIKKYKYPLLAFILALFIIGVVFLINGIFSGDKHLLVSDLYHQYYKLFSEYKELLIGNSSMFYSFSKALGGSMISTYGYYLTSPFNLLLFFFDNIYHFIVMTIIIKFSLMSLTMFTYLKYHFKDNTKNIIGALCYTFSLFTIGNYFNIIWLDAFLLGPLILLGIDKLIIEKKPILYIGSLFFAIISNFYMGFILCLFSIIYFTYRCFIIKEKNTRTIINFITISFLTGLSTMFLHLPNILLLFSHERVSGVEYGLFNLDILDHLSKTLMLSQDSSNLLNQHSFLTYIGMIMIPLLIFYFVNKKIKLREKIISASVIVIFLLSIFINQINFVWSFFSAPNCFNGRYVFIFSAFFIMLAIKSFTKINNINKKEFLITSCITIPLLTIIGVLIHFINEVDIINIIIGLLTIVIYFAALYILRYKNISLILIMIVMVELTLNFNYTFSSYIEGNDTTESLYSNETFCNNFNTVDSYSNKEFYRTDMYTPTDYNNSFFCSYNGVTGFLSTNNMNNGFYNDYGYGASTFDYDYIPFPVMDSILGMEYILSNYPLRFYEYKEDGIYYNEQALSLGYMIDSDEVEITDNVYINQNNVIKAMTGLDLDVYTLVEQNQDGSFDYNINEQYFFSVDKQNVTKNAAYEIYINKEYFKKIHTGVSNNFYIYSYYQNTNTLEFTFRIADEGEFEINNIQVVTYNKENLEKHIEVLQEQQLQVTEFEDGYIKGSINVLEGGLLFTSIPYEEGWLVSVNDEIIEYEKTHNSFISLELKPGNYQIEMVYKPKGIIDGLVITILSILALITYIKIMEKNNT